MKRIVFFLSGIIALFALASWLRPGLESQRRDLGLVVDLPEDVPQELEGEEASPTVALIGSSMGVFRPLFIDLLWLRAIRLQRQGRFFESAALARFIAMLQPRLPDIWSFWAHNLAYNVSAEMPPEDRYDWVLEGISLIRDEGLTKCPTSSRLYAELAFIFLHKIGLDYDDAHFIYKERLAETFEPPAGLPPAQLEEWRRTVLASWKIDPSLLERFSARYLGEPPAAESLLDLRSADSHALYWLETGAIISRDDEDRPASFRIRRYRIATLQGLLARGLVVRPPGGRLHAYLPDLRWIDPARDALLDERERYADDAAGLADLEESLDILRAETALYLRLGQRIEDAHSWFEQSELARSMTLEALVLQSVTARDDDDGPPSRERTATAAVVLLKASICLSLIDEPDLSGLRKGMREFGRKLLVGWNSRHAASPLPSPEEVESALARRLYSNLSASPDLADLAARIREAWPDAVREGASSEELIDGWQQPAEMPSLLARMRLEALDPLARAEAIR